MHYDPRDPEWPDRDRFVLSSGHACILQYAMLHLTGYDLSLEDLRQFRQWGSRTPGHPEVAPHGGHRGHDRPARPGLRQRGRHGARRALVRTTLRQPRSATTAPTSSPSDGCFMEGISHEAASLAGHLGLGRLLAVYDDNHITIDGPTELAYDDDVVERFEAYGWRVRNLGEMANDVDGLEAAVRRGARPPGRRARRQADPARAAQPHRLALAPPDRHRGGARLPVRRGRDPGHQGDPGPAARRDVLGARRGARLLRAAGRPRRARSTPPGPSASTPGTATAPPGTPRRPGTGSPGWADDLPRFEAGTKLATRHAINQCIDATVGAHPGPGGRLGRPDRATTGCKVKGAEIQSTDQPRRDRRSTTASASTAWARS